MGTPSLCPPHTSELGERDSQQVQSHGGPATLASFLGPQSPPSDRATVVLTLEQREHVFPAF